MAKRKDATLVKFDEPYHMIATYIMPRRAEAEVCMWKEFDVTDLLDYIKDYNEKNGTNLKFFHCFCYALGRTIHHREQMNYFIKGKRYWKRNDISLAFVAKQQFKDDAEEKLMFMKVNPDMNVNDVSKTILGDVKKAREANRNDLDDLMNTVGKLPRFLLNLIIWVTQALDFYGLMPESLSKGDPNYATAIISNLGSIKASAPYHHLSNYGTCSVMICIGTIEEVDGRKKVNVSFTVDERIADGFYFVKSLRYIDYVLAHPETMFETVSEKFPEGII